MPSHRPPLSPQPELRDNSLGSAHSPHVQPVTSVAVQHPGVGEGEPAPPATQGPSESVLGAGSPCGAPNPSGLRPSCTCLWRGRTCVLQGDRQRSWPTLDRSPGSRPSWRLGTQAQRGGCSQRAAQPGRASIPHQRGHLGGRQACGWERGAHWGPRPSEPLRPRWAPGGDRRAVCSPFSLEEQPHVTAPVGSPVRAMDASRREVAPNQQPPGPARARCCHGLLATNVKPSLKARPAGPDVTSRPQPRG